MQTCALQSILKGNGYYEIKNLLKITIFLKRDWLNEWVLDRSKIRCDPVTRFLLGEWEPFDRLKTKDFFLEETKDMII